MVYILHEIAKIDEYYGKVYYMEGRWYWLAGLGWYSWPSGTVQLSIYLPLFPPLLLSSVFIYHSHVTSLTSQYGETVPSILLFNAFSLILYESNWCINSQHTNRGNTCFGSLLWHTCVFVTEYLTLKKYFADFLRYFLRSLLCNIIFQYYFIAASFKY